MSSPSAPFLATRLYTAFERNGVTAIVSASLLTLFAIVAMLLFGKPRKAYPRTHVIAYFICLLVGNTIQATGTAMSLRWISQGRIDQDMFCQVQGAVKQTGNLAMAVWSFMIALHLFNLLFLRFPTTGLGLAATISFGWAFVATIVILGPAAIQTPEKGFYFGISGNWCWITDGYPKEQTYLEYFFEFISAGTSFVLYVIIILRVRGNIYFSENKWRIRFLPKDQGWQLSIGRDILDTTMLKVAKHMVWYPIAYTVILVPISLARLIEFAGGKVPDWAPIFTDVLFNLIGFINVVIFLSTRRFFPDVSVLPEFTMQRKEVSPTFLARGGVSPFPLGTQWMEKRFGPGPAARAAAAGISGRPYSPTSPSDDVGMTNSRFSVSTISSLTSVTPLRKPEKILAKWFSRR